MFIGHYGVSYLAKGAEKSIPFGLLFIAVQLIDILWATFVVAGIEKVRVVPGINATNALDLYYMPYTHSLAGALCWGLLVFLLYKFVGKGATRAAVIVGAAVFSHWVLDLVVHMPDLSLYDDTYKMGFGLWNYPAAAITLEAITLFAGMYFYLRRTTANSVIGKIGMPVFGVFLVLFQIGMFFSPPPSSISLSAALMGVGFYLAFAGIAFWLERYRT